MAIYTYQIQMADVEIKIADWTNDCETLKAIRHSVFIEEQNVPVDLEWDGLDERCVHFLVIIDDRAVATARFKPDGQIGRMAVVSTWRRKNIGSRLLEYILAYAEQSRFTKVYLHAQTQVMEFYLKHGFEAEGNEFIDAGIPHCTMFKTLQNH